MQANLRGDTGESSANYWTPLGVVRFARADWDTRLGPSDGALTKAGGVTFAPVFFEAGRRGACPICRNAMRANFVTESPILRWYAAHSCISREPESVGRVFRMIS